MSVEELREECRRATEESNQRWYKIPKRIRMLRDIIRKTPSTAIAVKVYDLNEILVAEFQSMKEAARESGACESMVRKSVMKNIFIKTKYGVLRFER